MNRKRVDGGYALVAIGVALPPGHLTRPDVDAAAEGQRFAVFLSEKTS